MSLKSSMRLKQRRKAGDPWVSTNRVLNGLGKKPGNFGRNPNFDADETRLLIQLWGEPKVQRALITTHKKHAVIAQLAQKMQDYGYFRSSEEITTRIKNLKCFYNRIKKDEESCQDGSPAKPSWKHYTEMDAIMTRPIFSVRPNEIPAPSLKYRLEQAREERAERRKLKQTEGTLASDPITDDSADDDDDDSVELENRDQKMVDDGIIPDVEVDINISDETFAAMTQTQTTDPQSKKSKIIRDITPGMAIDVTISGELIVKNEESNSSCSENLSLKNITNKKEDSNNSEKILSTESDLLQPKQEPIDVDADDNIENKMDIDENNKNASTTYVKQIMPTLPDISSSLGGQVLIPVTSITTVAANTIASSSNHISISSTRPITTTTTTNTMSIISPTSTTTTTLNNKKSMSGKISLVPTNFLMQPAKNLGARVVSSSSGMTKTQPQQIHLIQSSPQLQSRILLSGGTTSQGGNNSTNTGIMTTGPGGMKVLLLSAEQAAAAATGNTAITGLGNFPKTLGNFMPLNANMLLQTQLQSMQQQPQKNTTTVTQSINTLPIQPQVSSCSSTGVNSIKSKPNVVHQLVSDDKVQATRIPARKKLNKQQQEEEQQYQQRQQQQEQQYQQQQSEPLTRRDATNLRILIRQLLNAQFEANAINSRRWKVERDRLEFEKSLSERFFDTLPTVVDSLKEIFKPMQQQQQQQQQPMQSTQQQQQPMQSTQQQQQIFQAAPFMTVTSAGTSGAHLRLQPPKLLFTTVRHNNTAQNTISLASPSLTPQITTKTNVTSNELTSLQPTTIHDNENHQLLIPKSEPKDN